MGSLEMFLCLLLVSFAAYLAASEVALFSLSRFQLRSFKERFRSVYKKIKHLLNDPSGLLITLLFLNEITNISLTTLITNAISDTHIPIPKLLMETPLAGIPDWFVEMLLGIVITTPILLIFCEITPKIIGARMNRMVVTMTAGSLFIIYELLKPVSFTLKKVMKIFSKAYRFLGEGSSGSKTSQGLNKGSDTSSGNETLLKESDFLLMLEEGHKEGAIQGTELELIRNVFDLDNTVVREVATPLSQVISIPAQTTVSGALSVMRSYRYSRIPVVGSHKKEIVGILYAKDLLRKKLEPQGLSVSISTLMRKPYFVSESTKLSALFRKFKRQKMHMGIVKEVNGDVVGIITMNDILYELFEDTMAGPLGEEIS